MLRVLLLVTLVDWCTVVAQSCAGNLQCVGTGTPTLANPAAGCACTATTGTSKGHIDSYYPNNFNCRWVITSSFPGVQVYVKFDHVNVDDGEVVTLHDCTSAGACGGGPDTNFLPYTKATVISGNVGTYGAYVSTTGGLLVKLKSDASYNWGGYAGFIFDWWLVCPTCPAGSTGSSPTCTSCLAGTYKPDAGSLACSNCDKGKYSASGATGCAPCAQNYYSNSSRATTCQVCPTGSSTSGGTGATDCTCYSAYSNKENTGDGMARGQPCTACPVGTYATVPNLYTCVACASGYTSSPGTQACFLIPDCAAGQTGEPGSCTSCIAGKYKGLPGSGACTDCAAGTYSATVGASASSACLTCPENANAPSSSTACTCNAGFTGAADFQCSGCVAGKYKDLPGSGACTNCAAATYSATVGASASSACSPCPSNSYAPASSTAVAACMCNKGFTGSNGGTCAACGAGTYKASNGTAACSICGTNSYTTLVGSSSCTACPSNSYAPASSTAIAACICNAGYTGSNGGTCAVCDAGTYKTIAGDGGCTQCAAGQYNAVAGSVVCADCPLYSNSQSSSTAISDCICNVGYTGLNGGTCAACGVGWYKPISGSSACTNCAAATYSATVGASASSACSPCPSNSYAPASSTAVAACMCNKGFTGSNGGTCAACGAGTYKSTWGTAACSICGTNSYTTLVGSSSCPACPSNSYAPASSTAVAACICNAGYTGSNGGTCAACGAGTYKTIAGDGGCTQCAAGRYNAVAGSSVVCDYCPWYSNSQISSSAVSDCICIAGYTGSNGGPCPACGVGWYKPISGSSACTNCPTNTFSATIGSSSCNACPSNSYAPASSTAIAACICNAGYTGSNIETWNPAAGFLCVACGAGTYKTSYGSAACSICGTNSYTTMVGSSSCTACRSNSYAPASSTAIAACTCNAGFTSLNGGDCTFSCVAGTYKAGSTLCSACPALTWSSVASTSAADCWCVSGYIKIAGACATMVPRAVAVSGSLAGVSMTSSVSSIENAIQALRASIALRLNVPIELVQIERLLDSTDVRVSIFGRSETELNIMEGQLRLATTAPTMQLLPFRLVTNTYTRTSVLAGPRAVVLDCRLLNVSATAHRRFLLQTSSAGNTVVGDALAVMRVEMGRQFNVSLTAVRVNFEDMSADQTLRLNVTIDVVSEKELQRVRTVASALVAKWRLVLANSLELLVYATRDAGASGLNFTSVLVRADGLAMTLSEVSMASTLSALRTQLSVYYGVPASAVEVTVVVIGGVHSVQSVVRAVYPATVESLQERFVQASPTLDVSCVTLALPFNMTNMYVSYVSVPGGSGVSMPNAVSIESELVYADGWALSSSEVAQAADTLLLQMSRFYGVDVSLVKVEVIPSRNPAVSNASSVRVLILCGAQAVDDVLQRAEQMPATAVVRVVPVAIAGLNNAQMTALQGQMVAGRFVECPANYRVYNGTCLCAVGYALQSDLSTCTACASGKYGAAAGARACADCPANTFSVGASTACRACQENAVSSAASTSVDACLCVAGYFSKIQQ